MKVVLTTLNAKFIHSSLALHSIKSYCRKYEDYIEIAEYTINHQQDYVLRELFQLQPDILGFSCYIWNIEQTLEIIKICKQILPKTLIILGGPEVSFEGKKLMEQYSEVDMIVLGEGERTFYELMEYFRENKRSLQEVNGILYRQDENIYETLPRRALALDDIPFPYEKRFHDFSNRIIYYETTRGCPYQCQYCLSSIEKGVRFLSLERIYSDLQIFLDAQLKQVKFVDRTFNCKKSHALSIWKYLKKHDNGITNFHFEISADLLDEEILEFLATVRPGLFQFEIGVQSTNLTTIDYIKRKMNFEKLSMIVKRIKGYQNIHQHLDLIAGLPGEGYDSFQKSFDDVYALEPEQLQLGFLKLLKGSGLRKDHQKYGLVYKDKAPYEILYTKDLTYKEMLKLKMIEEMVEIFYNSGKFPYSIKYILLFYKSPFSLYQDIATYWEDNLYHQVQHSKIQLYTILLGFFEDKISESTATIREILKFDMYLQENVNKLPKWLKKDIDKEEQERVRVFFREPENIRKYIPQLIEYTPKQISRMVHLEIFEIDIVEWIGKPLKQPELKKTPILFNYYEKTHILNNEVFYKVHI